MNTENTANTTTETTRATTRNQMRGLCAACGNQQAVRTSGLAQHGYRRPWEASGNVAPCYGSGRKPHEVSPALAQDTLRYLAADLKRAQERVETLRSPDLTEVRVERFGVYTTLHRDTAEKWQWRQAVDSAVRDAEYTVHLIGKETARVEGLLVDWAPKALVEATVETGAGKAARKASFFPEVFPEGTEYFREKGGYGVHHGGGRNYAIVRLSDRKLVDRASTRQEALRALLNFLDRSR
jgi:hypothetical protein